MHCGDWNEFSRYVAGSLEPDERSAVDAHVDACDDCRELLVELARSVTTSGEVDASSAPLKVGDSVGRYVIREWLGEGGMGTVFRAADPQLERDVALKLVRTGDGPALEDRAVRLLREATLMARIAHPSVVSVYDAGFHAGRVYLIQELVVGGSLEEWQRVPRTVPEILERYLEAGRGLVAAHAAGVLHRDFKPRNVLVGHDGRARVTDFGLARTRDETASDAVGTPRYMAPEQKGGVATPRSDQFSFAVALSEALKRARGPVPKHLWRALARATSTEPAQRFPSVDALLTTLGHDPVRARRRHALLAAAALVTGGLVWAWTSHRERTTRASCEEQPVELEAIFTALQPAPAAVLRDWAARWTHEQHDACADTHARGEQSVQLLELRMDCLERQRLGTRMLGDLLVRSGQDATKALGTLPRPETCADARILLGPTPPPEDPAVRASVTALRRKVDQANALRMADHCAEGLELVQGVGRDAVAIHYRPLEAEAARLEASFLNCQGHMPEAEDAYHRAIRAGTAGKHDHVVLRAYLSLAYQIGVEQRRFDEAEHVLLDARSVLERFGPDDELEGKWQRTASILYRLRGRFADAERAGAIGVQLIRRTLGPNAYETGYAEKVLALALIEEGKLEAAEPLLLEAIRAFEAFGPDNPPLVSGTDDLATLRLEQGRPAEALTLHRRIREHVEAKPGRDLVYALHSEARDLGALGRLPEARATYERARAVAAERTGKDDPERMRIALDEARLGPPATPALRDELERAKQLGIAAANERAAVDYWLARSLPAAECARAHALATAAGELLASAEHRARRGEETRDDVLAFAAGLHCFSQKP